MGRLAKTSLRNDTDAHWDVTAVLSTPSAAHKPHVAPKRSSSSGRPLATAPALPHRCRMLRWTRPVADAFWCASGSTPSLRVDETTLKRPPGPSPPPHCANGFSAPITFRARLVIPHLERTAQDPPQPSDQDPTVGINTAAFQGAPRDPPRRTAKDTSAPGPGPGCSACHGFQAPQDPPQRQVRLPQHRDQDPGSSPARCPASRGAPQDPPQQTAPETTSAWTRTPAGVSQHTRCLQGLQDASNGLLRTHLSTWPRIGQFSQPLHPLCWLQARLRDPPHLLQDHLSMR
jgi:hypothetical protein